MVKKVYAMVENEKVLLGEITWARGVGDQTIPNFKQVQILENMKIIMVGFAYVDCDQYVASWEIYTNEGKVYCYYTDFSFEKLANATQENKYMVQYANELIIQENENVNTWEQFKKQLL